METYVCEHCMAEVPTANKVIHEHRCQKYEPRAPASAAVAPAPSVEPQSRSEEELAAIEYTHQDFWECEVCTLINPQSQDSCSTCGRVPSRAKNSAGSSPVQIPNETEANWTCRSCTLRNSSRNTRCEACGSVQNILADAVRARVILNEDHSLISPGGGRFVEDDDHSDVSSAPSVTDRMIDDEDYSDVEPDEDDYEQGDLRMGLEMDAAFSRSAAAAAVDASAPRAPPPPPQVRHIQHHGQTHNHHSHHPDDRHSASGDLERISRLGGPVAIGAIAGAGWAVLNDRQILDGAIMGAGAGALGGLLYQDLAAARPSSSSSSVSYGSGQQQQQQQRGYAQAMSHAAMLQQQVAMVNQHMAQLQHALGNRGRPAAGDYMDVDRMPYEALLERFEAPVRAVDPAYIEALPTRVVPSAVEVVDLTDGGEETSYVPPSSELQVCSICMEAYVAGQVVKTLPCLHQFHQNCVDTWLHQACTCPVCKYSLR